jgi:hypothetical protein
MGVMGRENAQRVDHLLRGELAFCAAKTVVSCPQMEEPKIWLSL